MGSRFLALLFVPGIAAAAEAPQSHSHTRVALALSGGGARGIAHIGALRALEEAGIPIDAIAANSMGAIVGAIYATGRDAAQLEQIVGSMEWASLFSGRPDRRTLPVARRHDRYAALAGVSADWRRARLPAGVLADHRVNRFLIQHLAAASYAAAGDFDRLPIRFRAVATDLATGERVVLARGDLARAVRASVSIPLAFAPVDWQGLRLVDGLVSNNLPIDVARQFEPQVLVAVDISSPRLLPSEYESALGVATQVNDLLTRRRNSDFERAADVLVRPDLGKHAATDYSGFAELQARAYAATKAALPQILERLAGAGASCPSPRPRTLQGARLEGTRIVEVAVEGNDRVSDRLVRRTFNVPVGPGYVMERGLRAFDKIEATGLFASTWMEFEPQAEGVRLVLRVKEASPNRAELGLGYTEWERARGSIRLRNQNTFGSGEQLELLAAGSDAQTLLQASLRSARLLVAGLGFEVRGQLARDKPRFFEEDGAEINRAEFERDVVDAALRSSLERWGLVEAGLRLGRVRTRAQAGIDLPDRSDQVGALFAGVSYDTLDDLAWPEHGQRLAIRAEWSIASLDADREFRAAFAEGRLARLFGRRLTLQLDVQGGVSRDDLPVYDWYRLGGSALLPGYRHEELKGAQSLAAAFSARYEVLGQFRLLARAGAGNVFVHTREITLRDPRWGLGVGLYRPSPIGPVAVELGVRNGGATLISLSVGWN